MPWFQINTPHQCWKYMWWRHMASLMALHVGTYRPTMFICPFNAFGTYYKCVYGHLRPFQIWQGRLLCFERAMHLIQLRKWRKAVLVISQVTLFIIHKAIMFCWCCSTSLRLGLKWCFQTVISLLISLVTLNDNVYALILQNIHGKTSAVRQKIHETAIVFSLKCFAVAIWYWFIRVT